MGALVESEALGGEPPAVGSRYRDVFEDHGQRLEVQAELVTFEPPRRLVTRIVSRGFESTSAQELEEREGGTRLATTIETTYTSRAARIFAPLVTRHAQKRLEADLAALKELVEAGAR
jgi:hypothetical protein